MEFLSGVAAGIVGTFFVSAIIVAWKTARGARGLETDDLPRRRMKPMIDFAPEPKPRKGKPR